MDLANLWTREGPQKDGSLGYSSPAPQHLGWMLGGKWLTMQ